MSVFVSTLSGAVFAGSTTQWQCIALVSIICIQSSDNRKNLLAVFAFFLAASAPVIVVAQSYNGSYTGAFITYIVLVTVNAAPLSIAVTQLIIPKWIAIPLTFVLLSLPPLSWINPLSLAPLAGWMFPETGYIGLVALSLLIVGLCMSKYVRYPIAAVATVATMASSPSLANPLETEQSIQGVSIARPQTGDIEQGMYRTAYRFEELDMINAMNARISVLPESVFGEWVSSDGTNLSGARGDVYGGARRYINDNEYINVVVDAKNGQVIYEQRNPPRVISNNGVVAVAGQGIVVNKEFNIVLCYELANPWIAADVFSQSKPVVWMSNLSWSNTDFLERRMLSTLTAWSTLFGVPVQAAVMRHA